MIPRESIMHVVGGCENPPERGENPERIIFNSWVTDLDDVNCRVCLAIETEEVNA